jgi:pentatricopeptide repeat protein
MRTPFICRQCLSRLQQSSAKPLRLARSSIHTLAEQTQTHGSPPAQLAQLSRVPEERRHPPTTADVPLRKLVTKWEDMQKSGHVGLSREREYFLRTKILTAGNGSKMSRLKLDKSLIDDFMSTYGFPYPTAREALFQLRELSKPRGRIRPHISVLLDQFIRWKTEYSSLLQGSEKDAKAPTNSVTREEQWAIFSDGSAPSVESMRAAWLEKDRFDRRSLWPDICASIMRDNPQLLQAFVAATYDPSWSPTYVVADLIHMLLLHEETTDGSQQLVDLIFFLFESTSPTHIFRGETIRHFMAFMSTAEVLKLYELLMAKGSRPRPDTLLHFASCFGKSPEHKALAAEIIGSLPPDFDRNGPAAASVCASIIGLEEGGEAVETSAAPDVLFKKLLDSGLRPNLVHLTALMRNLCLRGRSDTAWAVFDMLPQYGIEPDKFVYSTLLNAAKKDIDITAIQHIMSWVHSRSAASVVTLNEFLDIIYKDNKISNFKRGAKRRQHKSNNAFRPMLQTYVKFFRLEPLQKLFNFPLESGLAWKGPGKYSTEITELAAALTPLPDHKLLEPDTITLTLMLRAATQSRPFSKPVIRLFRHFSGLLQAGDSTALRLVEERGALIYDIFLRAILQFRECLEPAMRLVKAMQQRAADEKSKNGRNIRHPSPSVYTYTILMNGFTNHRRIAMTEAVFNMMRKAGVEPNRTAWNSLIRAYSIAQKVRGAVRALIQMEKAGLEPDPHTFKVFNTMPRRLREHALQLLEEAQRARVESGVGEEHSQSLVPLSDPADAGGNPDEGDQPALYSSPTTVTRGPQDEEHHGLRERLEGHSEPSPPLRVQAQLRTSTLRLGAISV